MTAFLYGCRPERLAALTVADLVGTFRVDARAAEYALVIARQRRAGEAA